MSIITTTTVANPLQAAIAAEHARAETPVETDWRLILGYYRSCFRSLVAGGELNEGGAVAMVEGAERVCSSLTGSCTAGELQTYHLASARADLLRQLGRKAEAIAAYGRAGVPAAPGGPS